MTINKILRKLSRLSTTKVFEELKNKGFRNTNATGFCEYTAELLQTGSIKFSKWKEHQVESRYFQVISIKKVTGYKDYRFLLIAEKSIYRQSYIHLSITLFTNAPKSNYKNDCCPNCSTPDLKTLRTASGKTFCSYCTDKKIKKAFFNEENI